jgi:hypothetical protein
MMRRMPEIKGVRRWCALALAAAAMCAPASWAQSASQSASQSATTPSVLTGRRHAGSAPGASATQPSATQTRISQRKVNGGSAISSSPATQPRPVAQSAAAAPPAPARPQIRYRDGLLSIWTENSTLADVLAGVRQKTGAAIDAPPAASNERVAVNLGPAPADEVLTKLLNGSRFDYIILNAPQRPATVQRVILQEKQGGNAATAANNAPITAAPQPQQAEDNGDVGMPDTEVPEEVQPEPGAASTNGAQPGSPDQQQQGTKTPEQLLEELKRMQQQQQQIQQQQQQQRPQQIQPQPQIQMQPQPQPPQAGMPPDVNSPPPQQPEDE